MNLKTRATLPASGPVARTAATAVPDATRATRPGWRDPRLWLGLAIVAACVLVGARVMASADDTVAVWSTSRPVAAGSTLQQDDLTLRRVHFSEASQLDRYVTGPAPAGAVAARDLGAGELLPRSAIGSATRAPLVQVPLSVQSDDVPATARRGAVVDVWVTPTDPGQAPRARRVLEGVTVVALPDTSSGLSPRSTRQVIVGVRADAAAGLGDAIGAVSSGRVVLTVAAR